jgi:Transglutaminase-like superfamily
VRLPGSTREPLRSFSAVGKLMLAAEIAATYLQVRWWLRRPEITEIVALARPGARPREAPLPAGRRTGLDHSREAAQLGIRLGKVIQRIFRLLPGDTRCLTRSVVLMRMLARRQVDTTLIIGVRAAPSFGAHAWIEHQGRPLLEPIEAHGQRLVEL